uniref:Uncharacterized protein n=1 Tax=Rhizophora mucronata TaxID=61149 RepID=A0A2P2QWD9_RHIMU
MWHKHKFSYVYSSCQYIPKRTRKNPL